MDEREKLLQASEEAYIDSYRGKIADLVGKIEDVGKLQYIHRFVELFIEKWG